MLLSFKNLIVHGHSFLTDEYMFFEKRTYFETENYSIQVGLQPVTSVSPSDIFYTMFLNNNSDGIRIFVYKINIWNGNCTQATAFILGFQIDVLGKQIFEAENVFSSWGIKLVTFRFMSNVLQPLQLLGSECQLLNP